MERRAHHPAATERPGVKKSLNTLHAVKGSNDDQHRHLSRLLTAALKRPVPMAARAEPATREGAMRWTMDQFSGPSAGGVSDRLQEGGGSASTGRNALADLVMVGPPGGSPLRGVPIGKEAGHARIQVESLVRAGVPVGPDEAACLRGTGTLGAGACTVCRLLSRALVEEEPSHRLGGLGEIAVVPFADRSTEPEIREAVHQRPGREGGDLRISSHHLRW